MDDELLLASGALCGALPDLPDIASAFRDPVLAAVWGAGDDSARVARDVLAATGRSDKAIRVLWNLSYGLPRLTPRGYRNAAERLVRRRKGERAAKLLGYALAAQDLAEGLLEAAGKEIGDE